MLSSCAPLPFRQLEALLAAAARELIWGLRTTGRELERWRSRALDIPDGTIREIALGALERKRGNTYGAGMFWTLPRERNHDLLRLLVTYQVMWDFLDSITENVALTSGWAGMHRLHATLADALDPGRPMDDPAQRRDGGYLNALMGACRERCLLLPSYQQLRPVLVDEAIRVSVQAINHNRDVSSREDALRKWAAREFPSLREAQWFELAAAAGANLAIYALLSLAADTVCDENAIARVHQAYFPWMGTLATMLDSYVDQAEDVANDEQRYVGYYDTPELAIARIAWLIRRCRRETCRLKDGERHTLLIACMVAMYLSKDSARTHDAQAGTRSLAHAGGTLTRMLLPVLRVWRIAYDQRST